MWPGFPNTYPNQWSCAVAHIGPKSHKGSSSPCPQHRKYNSNLPLPQEPSSSSPPTPKTAPTSTSTSSPSTEKPTSPSSPRPSLCSAPRGSPPPAPPSLPSRSCTPARARSARHRRAPRRRSASSSSCRCTPITPRRAAQSEGTRTRWRCWTASSGCEGWRG